MKIIFEKLYMVNKNTKGKSKQSLVFLHTHQEFTKLIKKINSEKFSFRRVVIKVFKLLI